MFPGESRLAKVALYGRKCIDWPVRPVRYRTRSQSRVQAPKERATGNPSGLVAIECSFRSVWFLQHHKGELLEIAAPYLSPRAEPVEHGLSVTIYCPTPEKAEELRRELERRLPDVWEQPPLVS